MKRPSRLPNIIPTVRRSPVERANIVLAVVYVTSIVVVLMDVFVWRKHG
jgi:hypothetical protein